MDSPENKAAVWNKIGDAYRALKDIENAIQAYKKADDLDMGASPQEHHTSRHPGNLANLRELTNTERVVSDTNRLLSHLPKHSKQSEPSLESQALADGFQPVNYGTSVTDNYPPSDPPETKPSGSPESNGITDKDITASQVGDLKNASALEMAAKNSPLPIEKSTIVIVDANENTENLPTEVTFQDESEQIMNPVNPMLHEKIRDTKAKSDSNGHPGNDDLEELLSKVNIYENITRVNSTNDRAWDTLGKLYKSLGRYKDAIGAYQKAIEMAPEREVYYYYLGLLYSVEKQHDDAVLAFQFVLRKNPDYVLAHSALAGVYHRMGLENKANHHIANALPKMNNESAYNRACFYAICGDTELAFELLRLALNNKDTTIDWIKADPDLDLIRTDQRYQELISEIDQPAQDNAHENLFSSELEGKHNRLLPILNRSLAR